jgi:hypothetical protein
MGNEQSVSGLKLMEGMFPTEQKTTIFNDPKLKQKLDKEIAKGKIKADIPEDEEALDPDLDSSIDKYVREAWQYYDKKNQGFIEKKVALQFFKDSLELYAIRRGQKVKDVLAEGVNMSKALEESYLKMSKNGDKQANYNDFEDFINTYDIDEALGSMLNKNGVDIDINRVQFVDVSQMTGQARKDGPKPVYRDYPTD